MVKKILFLSLLVFGSSAQAVIIGGAVTDKTYSLNDAFDNGGQFVELNIPFNPPFGNMNEVGNDTFQDYNLYGFNEQQNITLSQGYSVDKGTDLLSGMTIASHYVFFDPDETTDVKGWVDFDSEILAIITSTDLLNASDDFLNNNVNYLNPGLRGLETGFFGDKVWIGDAADNELNRMYVKWSASTPGDYVRVITAYSNGGADPCASNPPGVGGCAATVPEPSPLALFFLGALGLTVSAKLKARKNT